MQTKLYVCILKRIEKHMTQGTRLRIFQGLVCIPFYCELLTGNPTVNYYDEFICEQCGRNGHIRHLSHRDTLPGDYCPLMCGMQEKCSACWGYAPQGQYGLE